MIYKLPDDKEALLARLKNETKTYEVVVRKPKRVRSLSQNALYWLWLRVISYETGETVEGLHEYFKKKYLPKETIRVFGTDYVKTKTTTDLPNDVFGEYLAKVYFEITSQGIAELKWPEENLYEEWRKYYEERH